MKNLNELQLDKNAIMAIADDVWQDLESLIQLDVSENLIASSKGACQESLYGWPKSQLCA
jgi:hypothetical protein